MSWRAGGAARACAHSRPPRAPTPPPPPPDDFAKYKIRSNSVCAGTIETPISAEERAAHGWTYAEWEALKTKDVMLGRVGHTREIANATLFFACDESTYCTAAHLMVDGGQTPCTVME